MKGRKVQEEGETRERRDISEYLEFGERNGIDLDEVVDQHTQPGDDAHASVHVEESCG